MKFTEYVEVNPKTNLKKGECAPFVEMANVSITYREPEKIEYKKYTSGPKFQNGDSVVARIEPCLQNGKRFFWKSDKIGFGSTEYIVFRAKEGKMDSKYLFYLLKTDYIKKSMVSSMVGATGRQRVNNDIFGQIEIVVPNIEKQKKIGRTLFLYDDLIENNQKQIKLLEEAAQRLYKEWFVDLHFPGHENTKIVDGVPEGWKKERLVDIAEIQYGYAFDGTLFNADKNGTPIIRIRNIPQAETMDYTTEHVSENYLVQNGDIIVGMDGEFHINAWAGNTAYLVQRVCCIRPKNTEIKGWLLQAIYEPIKFFERTVVGATVAHLGKKHLDSIYLLTSPEEFYEPFKTFFDKRLLLMNQNRKLREARDRLLPKLMSGEVEV